MTTTSSPGSAPYPTAASTSTPPTQLPGLPPPPASGQTMASPATGLALAGWLTQRRNEGATPDQISRQLVDSGWNADAAAQVALRSLRTSDRHRMVYSATCWGTGIATLGIGTALHLALQAEANPLDIAFFVTLMVVAAPIAVAGIVWSRRIEATEPHAIWSPTRRTLFATLALCTGVVGIFRMLSYTFNLVAASLGAEGYDFTPASLVQVLITLGLAVPLFWWSVLEWRRSNVALRLMTRPVRPTRED